MSRPAPLLATKGLTKDYPGLRALDGVSFELFRGEVHVLFGENGAGKSTLISILSGAIRPSAGSVEVDGTPVAFGSVKDARDRGISAVFQEFSLIPQMTVEENLFLGAEHSRHGFLDKRHMRREAEHLLGDLGFDLDPARVVDRLTRAEQQMVEIAKAFRSELSVLVLDEPTASLTDRETSQLFDLVRNLTAKGVGIVYITHRMSEIQRIGDRITVLRDGRLVATLEVEEVDEDRLVQLMTGREIGMVFPDLDALPGPGAEVLRLDGVTTADGSVVRASLRVQAGEIVGLAGLVGSGKSEIMQAAFGALPIASGDVRFKDSDIVGGGPNAAIRAGFLYLPPDRNREGLMMMRPVRENMSLAALDAEPFSRGVFVDRRGERRKSASLADRLKLSPNQPERAVGQFSGGNQQKAMLARSLTRDFDLIVLDEPTVGVDVGTRAAIYAFIVELARQGVAIVLISSDMPEILNLSTRAYVFYRGEIRAELGRSELTEEAVLSHFFEREAA